MYLLNINIYVEKVSVHRWLYAYVEEKLSRGIRMLPEK